MGAHYTYFDSIASALGGTDAGELLSDANWQKLTLSLIVGGGILAAGSIAARKLATPQGVEESLVPKRFSLTGLMDLVLGGFINYHDSILGKENRKYASLSASVFLFILISNMLGLVPGMPASTTTVWVNVGIAIAVFLAFNIWGIWEHGFVNYMKHFAGPVWWLAWFIFPLEIFSTFLRILTLNLRLYWNISADHLVLGIFSNLIPLVIPIIFLVLGTFVCFMQAFVFTTLTMIYVFLAVQHGEEGDH